VAAITDKNGAVVERYNYSPYGEATILDAAGTTVLGASTIANPWTFTGRRLDAETGLMYYRARYYDAVLGRFVGRDPLEYVDGLNLYQYVRNRPIQLTDPFGTSPAHIIRGGAYILCSACLLKFTTFSVLNYEACTNYNNELANREYEGSVFRCVAGELQKDWAAMPWWEKAATLAGCACCTVPIVDLFHHLAEQISPEHNPPPKTPPKPPPLPEMKDKCVCECPSGAKYEYLVDVGFPCPPSIENVTFEVGPDGMPVPVTETCSCKKSLW
jgi:RHS repeat-associated protein